MSDILDKDKIKESLTLEDITKIATDLGSNPPKKDIHGNLIFQTICHNINNGSYKLYYYEESCIFKCYTDCGDTFDVYDLVRRAKRVRGINLDFPDAVRYVARLTGKNYSARRIDRRTNNFIIDDWEFINRYKKREKPKIKLPVYDKSVLDVFRYLPHSKWLEEGITWNTMKKFGIGYYIKEDKITIPHFDIDGNLVGVRGRAMLPSEIEAGYKYMPLTVGGKLYNHPIAFNLYGLYENQDTIRKYGKVTIFEGGFSPLSIFPIHHRG